MKKNAEATLIRILEISARIMMRSFAVMFALLTLYALVCFFKGDGIIALMGAVAGALCTLTAWHF